MGMFPRFQKWLTTWADELQRREIARWRQETLELKEHVEWETGKPFQLTPEERRPSPQRAEGIDPETFTQVTVLTAAGFRLAKPQADSAEHR